MGELERLGQSDEFGRCLWRTLDVLGWTVVRFNAFGGGVGVSATYRADGYRVEASGETLAEAMNNVFQVALPARPPAPPRRSAAA